MAAKKLSDKIVDATSSKTRIQERNKQILLLIRQLKLEDTKRHKSVEELISQAYQFINSDVDTGVVGKDQILGNAPLAVRRMWAIELLSAMIKKTKDESKEDDQQQTQQSGATQPLSTTGPLPQNQTASTGYTGPTINLPSTGATQPLPATGTTRQLPNTGQTVPLPATGVTVPLTATSALAAVPLVNSSISAYQMHISTTIDNELEMMRKGAYGPQLQALAREDMGAARAQIKQHVTQKVWDAAAFNDYDLLAANNTIPEVNDALKRRSMFEDQMYNEGLLDENLLKNRNFKNYYEGNIADKIWAGTGPMQTISNAQLTETAGPLAQAHLLSNFQRLHPNHSQQFPNLFANARELLQKRGIQAVENVTRKVKSSFTGKIGAGIGTAFGPLGTAIGYTVGKAVNWLSDKIVLGLYRLIRQHSKKIAAAGAGLLGLGALTGNAFLAGAGTGLITISLAGAGPAGVLQSIGSGAVSFFGTLGALILAAFITPMIVGFIGIIVIVAFIFLIINNSGYISPFSRNLITDISTPAESLFMQVQKTASRTALPNGPWPQEVTYTITIRALETNLTNISYNNSYQITQDPQRATPPTPTLPAAPSSIPQDTSHTFTYTVSYGEIFRNSLVCDTFEVTATAGSTTDSASATACITIGESPVVNECPSGWPVDYSRGQRYAVTQGPNTTLTHPGEAVDVATVGLLRNDQYVISTHAGTIVSIHPRHPVGGNFILIRSTCNGREFDSYYGHMRNQSFAAGLSVGQQVTRGTRLGLVGRTGYASGEHVHYQFNGGLQMAGPYIPIAGDSLRGCIGYVDCGSLDIP